MNPLSRLANNLTGRGRSPEPVTNKQNNGPTSPSANNPANHVNNQQQQGAPVGVQGGHINPHQQPGYGGQQPVYGGQQSSAPKPGQPKSPWLDAMVDPVAGMQCYSSFMCLCDLHADGNHRLILVDLNKRIRIYKGATIQWEQKLMDAPVGIQCFHHEAKPPCIPTLAVASGHQIFVYRYLRPHLKYALPPVELNPREIAVWDSMPAMAQPGQQDANSVMHLQDSVRQLFARRDSGCSLSNRSMDLLAMEEQSDLERLEYVRAARQHPFVQQTAITCMDILKQNVDAPNAVSMVVFGSENRLVSVLDSNALDVVMKVELDAIPAFVVATGLYDVEYRLTVACRDGKVYSIKNGQLLSMVIELETQPVGLVRIDKLIYVGCMDQVVHCFHFKGKKQHSLYFDHPVTCLHLLQSPKTKVKALLVALKNGEVRTYNGKLLIHTLHMGEPVVGMCFGTFGREEGTLVLSLKSGAIHVKMLSRTANLEKAATGDQGNNGAPAEQDIPLDVPKKTKLYVDQTARERDNPVELHRIFQRDLCKLRLNTARAYVKLNSSAGGVSQGMVRSGGGVTQLRISATVKGMGPEFQIVVLLTNSGNKALKDLNVAVEATGSVYSVENPLVHVPLLVPGYSLQVPVHLLCVDTIAANETVRVSVCTPDSVRPVVTALLQMPVSEASMLE